MVDYVFCFADSQPALESGNDSHDKGKLKKRQRTVGHRPVPAKEYE